MKIIDEKGRIFGKINVIDFLVILFLLCALPAFYLGYKIIGKKTKVPKGELVSVEIKCNLIKLQPEVLKLISCGDQEKDENGGVIGEIVGLGGASPFRYESNAGKGQEINVTEGVDLKQMEARLELKVEPKKGSLYYKDVPIKIDSPLEFTTNQYSVVAIPIKNPEEIEERLLKFDIILKDLDEDTLKQISVGDKEVDAAGRKLAEILSLGKIEDSSFEFSLGGDNFITQENRNKKQITVKMGLKCRIKEDGNQLYFKGKKLEYKSPFEFKTDKYKVMGLLQHKIVKSEERVIDLHVILKDLDEDTLKKISVGDKEVDAAGRKLAEILSLGKIEDAAVELNLGGGNFVIGEDESKKQISAKMRLRCEVRNNNQLYFKDKEVERYEPFEFKTDKYKLEGLVAKAFVEVSPIKEKWILLRVKFSGLNPEISHVVQKGDIEKDASDKTVAVVSSIISDKPSQVLVLKSNDFITLSHPFNKDILLFLDVRCIEKDGINYFKNYPVKMGNNITFVSDLYSITGEIIGMEMK